MPALAEGLVDVWRADLSRERTSHLPPGESLRAERFVFQADRERWIRSRSILRMLLGSYLGADPLGLSFSVSEAGKPVVAGISFNLSHSRDMALYAFTSGAEVGVDVEVGRREVDVVAVASRVFGADEGVRLAGLPAGARQQEFLRDWVRHEAALKCRGLRLGEQVSLEGLSIVDLELGEAAAGAVAVDGVVEDLRLREFV